MTMSLAETSGYMMVRAVPLLNGQRLCGFLEEIDTAESTQIAEEERSLNTELTTLSEKYSWTKILRDGTFAALGIGGLISGAKYKYDHSSYAVPKFDHNGMQMAQHACRVYDMPEAEYIRSREWTEKVWREGYKNSEKERLNNADKETIKWFVIGSLIIGSICVGAELVDYREKKASLVRTFTLTINNNRYLRLQHKIREIGKRLASQLNEPESTQLSLTNDFFKQKLLLMEIDIKNTINVKVEVK
jgi:hypothetical protein